MGWAQALLFLSLLFMACVPILVSLNYLLSFVELFALCYGTM